MNKKIFKKFLLISSIIGLSFLVLFVISQIIFCHIYNENPSIGIKITNVLIKIIPNNAKLYVKRAEFKYLNNDINGTIQDLEKSLEINPKIKNVHGLLGTMYFLTKSKPQNIILEEFQKGIEQDNSIRSYLNRGSYFYITGEYDKAVKDYEQAYILSHDEYFIFLSAKVYEDKGEYCKALHYYDSIENKKRNFDMFTIRREYAKYRCKE